MDRKSIIILVVCFGLLLAWGPLVNKVFPPKVDPNWTNQVATATNRVTAVGTNSPVTTTPAAPATSEFRSMPLAAAPIKPQQPEQTLIVTNPWGRFVFSSHWGGVKEIELPAYPEAVGRGTKGAVQPATLNHQAPVPAFALLGGETLQGDGIFTLSQPAPEVVRAEKTLPNGLTVAKEFRLGSNYQFTASVRVRNSGNQPVSLPAQELVFGTATPMTVEDNGQLVGIFHYDGSKASHINEPWFANRTLGCIPGTPRTEFVSPGTNVVWAATHNQFFTIIARPAGGAPQVIARHVNLPEPTAEELAAHPQAVRRPIGFQTAFHYPAAVLGGGESVERSYTVYAGPKEYHTLSKLPERQELVMDFGGFFGWFAQALLISMNGLHKFGLGYGWAIVVITVVIKLLFWPLTQASTRSMKRMAKLQPQMKALQEKYKDDQQKMNQKLMEFMKENKVNPMGGCLPMLIQIPVFFGFYTMLQSAIELRGASFLWNADLSKPDTLFMIPGLNFPFNLMPLMMGATMLWQARLTPPSPGVDPTQQKIMKYMPLMFLVFLYNFSAGLTLYWTVQNLLSIAQMKLTKPEPDAPAAPVPAGRAR